MTRLASSSSSARNGRGLSSHTRPHETAMPITPPANVVASPSRRNCSRISRRVAPSALRTPISRVRSCTFTNMMFMMPTPPIASVSTPMKVSTIFSPPTMPAGDLRGSLPTRTCSAPARRPGCSGSALPGNRCTCAVAFGSSIGDTACHTNVLTYRVSASDAIVVHGMKMQNLSGPVVVRQLDLVVQPPTISNGCPPMRMVSPTGGMPPNSFRCTSVPMNATRRRSRTSSSSRNRPPACGCLGCASTPYDAATPRTRWLDCLLP